MTSTKMTSLFVLGFAFLAPGLAVAQDPTPQGIKPNILLLIDNSGSMEYKTQYSSFATRYPTCTPGNPVATNQKSRWVDMLEVLAGTIANYSCEAVSRTSSNFRTEFSMPGGTEPPDANYGNPYHRPISNSCVWTPDRTTAVTNAFSWVTPLQKQYPVNPAAMTNCTTAFTQTGGFIDNFGDLVRFGLMTFDPLPDESTGYASTTPFGPNYVSGVQGTWSYYGGGTYNGGFSFAKGLPAGCTTGLQTLEVGVRNGGAPASEGKMIYFGDQFADQVADTARHDRIKKVLLSSRPYGATPINGALSDARNFFWNDTDIDPLEPTPSVTPDLKISPQFDDQVECGCRDQHIILITDGEPNLDMRPECEAASPSPSGQCPFSGDPVTILADLYDQTAPSSCTTPSTGTNQWSIPTHVIGFATGTYNLGAGSKNCEDLETDEPNWNVNTTGICDTTTNLDLQTCCTLHEMASAGSGDTEAPYIAPTAAELEAALADIVSGLVNASASATRPVRSPGIGLAQDPGDQIAFRILSSYQTRTGTSGLWRGTLERGRYLCSGGVPVEQEKDLSQGDDFSHNVEAHEADRVFYTVVPDAVSSIYYPENTIRPYVTGTPSDGLGALTNVTPKKATGSGFVTTVDAGALNLTAANYATQSACSLTPVASSAALCRNRVLNWTLGYADDLGNDRCASATDRTNCSLIGDVMHSAPVIVDRPKAPVEDETYAEFAKDKKGRMMMMYVSSNDGILHGFAVSPNDATDNTDIQGLVTDDYNNEHFAFIPPFVLPQLKTQYPETRQKLLDGTAIVQDVVAITNSASTGYDYKLERSLSDTKTKNNTWRTILVQGFGGEQSGYFALDITDTRKPSASTPEAGPQFLWQISKTSSGNPLFGKGGTPLITTLNVGGVEVAVAVLPGGRGGSSTGTAARKDPTIAAATYTDTYYRSGPTGTGGPGAPRANINTYAPADVAANSLTIVRLDTGEILRTFWYAAPVELDAVDGNAVSFIDSPITGIPAAFPSGTGMVADRIFVGDQDGALWRIDVSPTDPMDWTMKLFHDSYGGEAATAGKSISIAPMLSVNATGQITVAYATGAQDLSGGSTDIQYIYSLTEAENGSAFYAKVNWYQRLTTGEHILGPMSLANEVLYFSTLVPAAATACSSVSSNIWGVDYLKPLNTANLSLGGQARFPSSSTYAQYVTAQSLVGGTDEVGPVYGVSLEYTPSCKTTSTTPEELGYLTGTRTAVTAASASALQLVFQTGTVKTSKEGLNFTTGFEAITLPQPRIPSTLLSWAAILD